MTIAEGELLHVPEPHAVADCNLTRYLAWLREQSGLAFDSYDALWDWSVRDIEAFWSSIASYFGVRFHTPYTRVLAQPSMPGAVWFEGSELNYADHALSSADDHVAIVYEYEGVRTASMTYRALADAVGCVRESLRSMGVTKGDRVVSYLPNCPEAVIAFLATASLGAIWSSCSPEFGVGAVLDRFQQIEPKALFAVDGYVYGGKSVDRRQEVDAIRRALPTLEVTVLLSRLGLPMQDVRSFESLLESESILEFVSVPFDHPLWILYSSGTTGLPKPIVQGHGGILVELYKVLSLHCDLGPNDRFFWFTTTGWMMWNFLVSGLLVHSTIVLYEGSPVYPGADRLWKLADDVGITYFGTSAPFILSAAKRSKKPKDHFDLRRIRALGSTGSPLPPEGFDWVYRAVNDKLLLASVSGGTDVCTAFVASCPLLPVHAGEIQCRALGCAVDAFDASGQPVRNEVGELVITKPMPSMPLRFWNDASGERMRSSYFERFFGVWSHGDWIKITDRGSCIIYGRSDATLNRDGVRMGTSEFYRVVEALPEIEDSLVVDTSELGRAGKLWLFVVLREGSLLDQDLVQKIRLTFKTSISPRHVPDELHAVPAIPRTLSGKKLEIPVRKILLGRTLEDALSLDTLKDPSAIEPFLAFRPL